MTQEVGLQDVFAAIEAAFSQNDLTRVEALLWPALDQFPKESRLWFYGGCVLFKAARVASAAAHFERAIQLDETPFVYSNLGACYRRLNLHEEGLEILRQAHERAPNYAPTLVNLGSMYVNEGCPEEGIPYLEKAKATSDERGAIWNLGLLYLESARFAEGFDHYRQGVSHERAARSFGSSKGTIPEPEMLTPELFEEHGGKGKRIVVWGEQGIGDELMFGTILEDMRKDFEVVFECHPRLQRLHNNAHPNLKLYPTRKEEWISWPIEQKEIFDFKCAIGDMASYYRRSLDAFKDHWKQAGATYRANPEEIMRYREHLLSEAGGRPIVALGTRGGVMQTARQYRTIRTQEIDRLMKETDAYFVSIDYDDMFGLANYISETHGEGRFRWVPTITQHWDYDHLAALLAACDMTVTVCQSAAHLSAGMGLKTRVLTPIRCAWRYAQIKEEPDLWYWYPDEDIKLIRQDDPKSWDHPINRIISDINELKAPKKTVTVSPMTFGVMIKAPSMGRRS